MSETSNKPEDPIAGFIFTVRWIFYFFLSAGLILAGIYLIVAVLVETFGWHGLFAMAIGAGLIIWAKDIWKKKIADA